MNAEDLRKRIRQPQTFADGVGAFYELVDHPDLTWGDLLDGLGYRGLVAECAAIQLHCVLKVPATASTTGLIEDRQTWETVLAEQKLKLDAPVKQTHKIRSGITHHRSQKEERTE